MNVPILVAGAIVFVAFLAHTFVGNREAWATRPPGAGGETGTGDGTVERHWVQSFCAFQLVTVDLLVLSAVLGALGATDLIPAERTVAMALAGLFVLWGVAWLGTLRALDRPRRDYGLLSQWAFWFGCAGLLFWGAGGL